MRTRRRMKRNVNRTRKMRGGGRKTSKSTKSTRYIKQSNRKNLPPGITVHHTPPPPPPGSTIVLVIHGHGRFMVTPHSCRLDKSLKVDDSNNLNVYVNTAIGIESKNIGNHIALTIPTLARFCEDGTFLQPLSSTSGTPASAEEILKSLIERLFLKHNPIERNSQGKSVGMAPHRMMDSTYVKNILREYSSETAAIASRFVSQRDIDKVDRGMRIMQMQTPTIINKTYTFDDTSFTTTGIKYRQAISSALLSGNILDLSAPPVQPAGSTSPRATTVSTSNALRELWNCGMGISNGTTPFDDLGVYKIYDSKGSLPKLFDGNPQPIKERFTNIETTKSIYNRYKDHYENIYILDFSCNGFSVPETVAQELSDRFVLKETRCGIDKDSPGAIALEQQVESETIPLFDKTELDAFHTTIGLGP